MFLGICIYIYIYCPHYWFSVLSRNTSQGISNKLINTANLYGVAIIN